MKIRQPRDFSTPNLMLHWNRNIGSDMTERFKKAQKFIDSECLRLMIPYTPARNLILVKSAYTGTVIGSGRIVYNSPYARYQYYGKLMVSKLNGSSYARKGEEKVLTDRDLQYSQLRHYKANRLWFEYMKSDKKQMILQGAEKILK